MNMAVSQRVKMLRMGYCKGVPDLLIYEPSGDYCGMAIEFKTKKGIVRPEQTTWLQKLRQRGWYAVVHRDSETAKEDFSSYISK